MQLLTWAQIKEKVENDLDLIEETFITPTELLGYANEAIDEIEALVHTLYEDYFLTSQAVTLSLSQTSISMPTNIYANKIRQIFFDNGSQKYEVMRARSLAEVQFVESTDFYRYIPVNPSAGAQALKLFPASRDAGSFMTIWYLRNANRLSVDADVCDIPEFGHVIIQHMKVRCYEKEGHPNLPAAVAKLEQLKKLMVETLTNMVPDENTLIPPDLSFYRDFNSEEVYS